MAALAAHPAVRNLKERDPAPSADPGARSAPEVKTLRRGSPACGTPHAEQLRQNWRSLRRRISGGICGFWRRWARAAPITVNARFSRAIVALAHLAMP